MNNAMSVKAILEGARVIPIVDIEHVEHAVPIARALLAGGIHVIEITLRTSHGLPAIEAIKELVPQMIVGAGTLVEPLMCDMAKEAGAMFGVSPGLTPRLVEAVKRCQLPLLPGVITPSEIMMAREAGFSFLKLFPAMPMGGEALLKSLYGPFPDVAFCATGGVSFENVLPLLGCKNVSCIAGSWLVPKEAIKNSDWEQITKLAKEASLICSAKQKMFQ
jgi:2-dehydro-3-deoxyphosphogluconate aldolase/(4S)-4-hydroxy-2-oxoglutarate aldolase